MRGLADEQEVYASRVGDENRWVYLAFLPWRREPRVTAVVGICEDPPTAETRNLLVDVHRRAVSETAELHLPRLLFGDEATGPGQTVLEYDWVVTDTYAGPDRRRRRTPFLSRYLVRGRRWRVPSRAARTRDAFVDRVAPWVRSYALAYFVLAALDTALTWWYVRRGLVDELNPVLRPLVLHHPWLFLATKNALAAAAFAGVTRFHLFRIGRVVLGVAVACFALVDAYWLWLLR
jgi:hypothetical protein